jgi:thiol:disulfide interchange protein
VVGETKINKIIFSQLLGISIILYICVFPWVSLKVEWVRRLANRFAVPIPRLIHIIACLLMALTYVLELMPSSKKGEMLEFGNCFVFFMILLYPRISEIYDPNVKLDPPA